MEQREALGAGLGGHVHGVLDRAVAPGGLRRELGLGVLRVVDQQVDVAAQLEHGRVDVGRVGRLLVVAHVGDRHAVALDPVAEGGVGVGHVGRGDGGPGDLDAGARFEGGEADVAAELVGPHGEERRPHELVEGLGEAHAVVGGAVDLEVRPAAQQRRAEGKALDVVPVEVGDEGVGHEGLVRRAGLAEVAQARAEVEQDRFVAGFGENDTRRVPAVAGRAVAGARGGTPHSVEGDVQPASPEPYERAESVGHGFAQVNPQ